MTKISDSGECCRGKCREHRHNQKGDSSWMHNMDNVFEVLDLKNSETFADLGCGAGEYVMKAAQMDRKLSVYAVDRSVESIEALKRKAAEKNLNNIMYSVSDITQKICFGDSMMDCCLVSTVLHAFGLKTPGVFFSEVRRILKTGGILAVIECKKEETQFGPPVSQRISEKELIDHLEPSGFSYIDYTDLGNNYMIRFSKK